MTAVCMLLQNQYDIDVRVRRKAEALVAAGYTVDVLALHPGHSRARSYVMEGVTVHTLALGKKRGSLVRYGVEYLTFFVWAACKLMSLMRTRQYAVIDVNTLPDFLVFAAAPARWMGAKVVLDMHEITPEFYMSKYGMRRGSLVVRLLTLVERLSFHYADHVLAINEPIRELFVARGLRRAKCAIIMNAVDESIFADVLESDPTRAERPSAGFVLMYHGTLTRIYGLDIAIEAFAAACKEMPGAEFWILGGGPERASLEADVRRLGIEQRVKFVGSVLPDQIPAWLNRSTIGVLPTRKDAFLDLSFSNKLSEYIIMGRAVIVARLAAIRHCFSDSALAYFEPQNVADLAEKMTALYHDTGLRSRYAAQAKKEFQPIRWAVMKQRYLHLISELAAVSENAGKQGST